MVVNGVGDVQGRDVDPMEYVFGSISEVAGRIFLD
jgi:hypothetical protein